LPDYSNLSRTRLSPSQLRVPIDSLLQKQLLHPLSVKKPFENEPVVSFLSLGKHSAITVIMRKNCKRAQRAPDHPNVFRQLLPSSQKSQRQICNPHKKYSEEVPQTEKLVVGEQKIASCIECGLRRKKTRARRTKNSRFLEGSNTDHFSTFKTQARPIFLF